MSSAHAGGGGVPARRAVVRWAWRVFRREWRHQALVLCLLTVAVAAAVGFATAAYNVAPAADDAVFGTAGRFIRLEGSDPRILQDDVAAAQEWFGVIDVISHRSVAIPGSVESVEFRAQDPRGAYGAPTLALVEGRYPTDAAEVAVTDHVAETFRLRIGGTFGLDGTARTVVGLVENPNNLNAEFALTTTAWDDPPESVTILIDAGSQQVESFLASMRLQVSGIDVGERFGNVDVLAAVGVLGIAAVALLLVSLVAAAGFFVVAQRRLRQLGMLGAIGATDKHLHLVVVAGGAVIGIVAAVVGTAVGVGGWIVVAPRLESAFGHRIDPLNVPWWLIATATALVVATATGAAWWPARTVARVPITNALSGRPPRQKPAHRSAVVAVGFLVGGLVLLVLGDQTSVALIGGGTIAVVAGVLLVSPLAIGALPAAARLFPFAMRLALRDLARYRGRSATALAAISLTLGIPAAIVITASAAAAADRGNLSQHQLVIWTRDPAQPEGVSPYYTVDPNDSGSSPYLPRLTSADLEALEAEVGRIADTLDEPAVTGLDLALDPDLEPTADGRVAITLARPEGDGLLDVALVFVATPELLDHYRLELDAIDPDAEVLTVVDTPNLHLVGVDDPMTGRFDPEVLTNVERIGPTYTSLPGSFVTPETLLRRGWDSVRVGWLVETRSPLTAERLAAARDLAADAGLLVEAREGHGGLASIRWQATAVGMLLALGVLAMTVGLIRGEAAGDLRTLTATGATGATRRTLTAATAGALAFLGAMLGTGGAYLGLAAGSMRDLGALTPVPVFHLFVIAAGVPLVAAGAGWLLSGREPPALARQAME